MNLSLVIQIVTLVTLLAGLFFGALELRRARQERSDKGALDVLGIAVRPDHVAASYAILELGEDGTPSAIANKPELHAHANTLMALYEYLGNLVYQRMVPLRTGDLLMGGIIRASWLRLRPFIEEQRAVTGLTNFAEWFQWLVERLQEYELPGQADGAHVTMREWKP